MSTDQTIATKPITPGAGVDPRKRIVPSKRVKSWHRSSATKLSLKEWLRTNDDRNGRSPTIQAWFDKDRAVIEAWFDSKAR